MPSNDAQRALDEHPSYADRPWDDPLCLLALEVCPWRDTDHDRGEGVRRENYCTWCDGFVTALIPIEEWAEHSWFKGTVGMSDPQKLAADRAWGTARMEIEMMLEPGNEGQAT